MGPSTPKPKGTPKDAENGTMENSAIVLPALQNGVIALGDLWDCRSSTAVGNLFDKTLCEKHLEVHPIQVLNYGLQRAKTAKDYNAEMHISVSLSLEAAGGQVKVKGKASFDREERHKFDQEVILCNYDLTTYEVRLRPNATSFDMDYIVKNHQHHKKNQEGDGCQEKCDEQCQDICQGQCKEPVLSRRVIELLNEGTMVATHYVQSVTLGGQAQASVTYYENLDHSHMNLTGSLDGTITIGPVTATAKASLQLLDSETNENINTEILIKAQPRVNSAPTNCEDMFKEIERLDEAIMEEMHFPMLNTADEPDGTPGRKIIGIPVRFRLLPLNLIKEVEGGEDTYQLMKQELLDSFSQMLLTLEDYSYEDYLMSLLREDVPAIVPILRDDNHPITQELSIYSNGITLKAQNLKREALQAFAEYKYGEKKEEDLRKCLTAYNEQIYLPEIASKVAEFGRRGRMELADIRSSDVINLADSEGRPSVNFFTNESDMTEWFGQERTIKILLQTAKQSNSNGVFQRLFQMSGPLREKNGVEIGIAFPGVSKDFSLTIKTSKDEVVIGPDEMVFALDLFRLATDTGAGDIFKLFFAMSSEMFAVKVPLTTDILNEFPTYMNIMRTLLPKNGNVFVCETYCDLKAQLSNTLDTLNFVCPLDAVNRGIDMVSMFKRIRKSFSAEAKHNWFFAKFDILSKFSSPLLFVFRDDILTSICYDILDIAILVHCLEGKEGHSWEPISVSVGPKSSLYIDQWNYCTEVVPKVVLEQSSFLSDPLSSHDAFPQNVDKKLQEALEITKGLASRADLQVFTSVAHLALKAFQLELEPILVEHCKWADNTVSQNNWTDVDWPHFSDDVRSILQSGTPALILINSLHGELKRLKDESSDAPKGAPANDSELKERVYKKVNIIMHAKINKMVSFVAPPEFGLEGIKEKIAKYDEWGGVKAPEDPGIPDIRERIQWFARRDDIVAVLQIFLIDETSADTLFHLKQLAQIGDQISMEGSISKNPISLAKAYCDRVEISSDTYPSVRDSLDTCLKKGQLFRALSILDAITVHPKLFVYQSECKQMKVLPAPLNTKSILEKMIEYIFDVDQLQVVWENSKFLHLVKTSMSNQGVVETLFVFLSTFFPQEDDDENEMVSFPMFIPQDVIEAVRPLFSRKITSGPSFPWTLESDTNILKFINQLQIFVARIAVPDNFQEVFTDNLVKGGGDLEVILGKENALLYWDNKTQVFKYNWTILAVRNAMAKLTSYVTDETRGKGPRLEQTLQTLLKQRIVATNASSFKVVDEWVPFVEGSQMPIISYATFIAVSKVTNCPRKLPYGQLQKFCNTILPFLLENLRNSNIDVLTSSFLRRMVSYPVPGYFPGQINFGNDFIQKSIGFQFTRDDLFTALFNSGDETFCQQILQTVQDKGLALPLVVNNISREQSFKYLSLLMPLQSTIRNESCLKCLTKRYRFVLTLRVGETSEPNIGRSSLLNHYLMKGPDTFNALSNDGSNLGRSISRKGYVEFVTLDEYICEEIYFWPEFSAKYGHLREQEPMHLGILHGNALDIPKEVYEHLISIASSIVVFWNVENWRQIKEFKKQLSNLLTPFTNVLDIVLYPDPSLVTYVKDENLLHKVPAMSINPGHLEKLNSAKLRRIIFEAFEYTFKQGNPTPKDDLRIPNSVIKYIPSPAKPESQLLLQVIKNNSVKKIKHALSSLVLSGNDLAVSVIQSFLRVLRLEKSERESALHHAFFELDCLSRQSSLDIRNKIKELRKQIILGGEDNNIGSLQQLVKVHLEKLQLNILTLQTLFYATGLYLLELGPIDSTDVKEFITIFSECILSGYPVEIQNSCDIRFLPLFQQAISVLSENTRVFTLSMIGLKDSGKSTLLNRLYGGSRGFSEFSGTKGVNIKLLWLTEELMSELECDAFLILDSEGISAPENEGNPNAYNGDPALSKERQFITFILSMSDLTLINTMTGDVGQLPIILESSLTTILRKNVHYETDGSMLISPPDMLIVNQTDDDTPVYVNTLLDTFSKSFDAVRSISKSFTDLGLVSKSQNRLVQINSSQLKGDMVLNIPPILKKEEYHQEISQLRMLIENKSKQSRSNKPGRLTLPNWFTTASEVWIDLQNEVNLPISIRALISELSFHQQFLQAKFALSKAFWEHEERIWNSFFDIQLGTVFGSDFKPGFDMEVELLMNKVSNDLLQVPNTCQGSIKGTRAKRGPMRNLRAGSVNPDACDECRTAFLLREELIEEVENGQLPRSFLAIEDIQSLTDQIRYQTYSKFVSKVLAKNIETQKSEQLLNFVKNITEVDGQVVYQNLIQHLHTLRFLPNSVEQFHLEFEIVYKRLRKQIVDSLDPFQKSMKKIDMRTVPLFDLSPYHSESSYAVPFPENRNKLTWDQDAWLQIQLEKVPSAIIKEFGRKGLYKWGMAMQLKARNDEILDLLAEKLGKPIGQLQLNFVWLVHFVGAKHFYEALEKGQQIWRLENDPVSLMEMRKEEFILDPRHFFKEYKKEEMF